VNAALPAISLVCGGLLSLAAQAEPPAMVVKSAPDVVIYDGAYPGWPWICTGSDGTLYCAFREGTEHGFSPSGKIMLSISRDRGQHWSEARTVIDAPEIDDRNVALEQLKDGRLFMVYNTYTRDLKSQTMATFSSNGGESWSVPAPIGLEETLTRSAVVELSDGSLLLPYYRAPGDQNYAVETTDGGKTWKPRRLVKSAADDFHLNSALAGPDGSIFVPSELGQIYRSLDSGATWDIVQTEYEGSFWGGLTLKDGSVLVVGMRGNVWRSKDKGTTWEQLAAEVTPESLSSGIQLDDGEIILVGIGGAILRSKDDGATWDTALSQIDRKGISAVIQGYDGMLLLMGEVGLRKKALDGTTPQG